MDMICLLCFRSAQNKEMFVCCEKWLSALRQHVESMNGGQTLMMINNNIEIMKDHNNNDI